MFDLWLFGMCDVMNAHYCWRIHCDDDNIHSFCEFLRGLCVVCVIYFIYVVRKT